jgi:aspartate/methionine/tyrosine aminotransferase
MFSRRIPDALDPNDHARLIAMRKGCAIDLTQSNPTAVGLPSPRQRVEGVLARAGAFPYEPDPRGARVAREAIAAFGRKRGNGTDPDRIWLTSGTSEAYSFLTKLLADGGDEILVPTPSYPLFAHLLRLEGVRAVSYPLRYAQGWFTDLDALEKGISPRTKAIVLVHPNNPTGHFVPQGEKERILEIAGRHRLPLIVDEVFLDFHLEEGIPGRSFGRAELPVVTFVLDGLSKRAGLPQLKLSWMALHGPEGDVARVAKGLDWISDLYLSVGTPVSRALPELLNLSGELTATVGKRIGANHRFLKERCRGDGHVRYLPSEGGWSAIVRLPDFIDEDRFVQQLIRKEGVVIHPGYFFDLPFRSSIVVSLLPEEALFREGIGRIVAAAEEGR